MQQKTEAQKIVFQHISGYPAKFVFPAGQK